MPDALLTQADIAGRLAELDEGWTGSTSGLVRSIEFAYFPTAVEFISRLAPHCEELAHHPDLDLRWRRVHITLSTHSAGGVTAKDFGLAEVIDEVADGLPKP